MAPSSPHRGTVTVRVYADLTFFAPDAASGVEVPLGRRRSVKDLLESLGVPHPEIGLLMRREITYGYCPRDDDPDEQVVEVARRFLRPDDLAPFSRCPRCNAPLAAADLAEVAGEIGPHTRATQTDFRRCTGCGQVYWPGSHVAELRDVVERVQAVLASPLRSGAPRPGAADRRGCGGPGPRR